MNLFDTARALELPPTRVADAAWDGAVKRHRRRRGLQGAAVLVGAAVAAGVYLGVVTSSQGDPEPAVTPVDLACPHEASLTDLPFPPAGTLPQGATVALLCPVNGADWQPPSEPLEQDLDQLVDLINTRPDLIQDDSQLSVCFGDHEITDFAITFTYPNGKTRAVSGDPGCSGVLRAGDEPRTGAALVLNTYLGSLLTQRADHDPAPLTAAAQCPERDGTLARSIIPADTHLDLQLASRCTYRWTRVGPGAYAFVLKDSVPLTATEIARLNQAFEANAHPTQPDYDVHGLFHTITGVTSWGDQFSLELLNGQLVRGPAPAQQGSESLGWQMSPADQAFLFGL